MKFELEGEVVCVAPGDVGSDMGRVIGRVVFNGSVIVGVVMFNGSVIVGVVMFNGSVIAGLGTVVVFNGSNFGIAGIDLPGA